MIQANVDSSYSKFIRLVGKARGLPPASSEDWAEGRAWDGGTARQLGLIDEFGGLDDALAYAAKAAKLEKGGWHAEFLGGEGGSFAALLRRLDGEGSSVRASADIAGVAAEREWALLAQASQAAKRLFAVRGIQAYCLECPPPAAISYAGVDDINDNSLVYKFLSLMVE